MNRLAAGCFALLLACASYAAEFDGERRWPRWRGPLDDGHVAAGSYPAGWKDGAAIRWKIELPGSGCSTPAVWDDTILVTSPADGKNALLAFDWEGQPKWQAVLAPARAGKHHNASSCNPSPVTDGERIFAYFKSGELAGLDFAGKTLWQMNLQERFGQDTLYWDVGTSPVLTRDAVIVAVMHSGESYLAAFDKISGELRWKVARNYVTSVEGDHSYTTPIVTMRNGRETILVWGGEHLTAHAADDGRLLWSCGGFNPEKNGNWVAVASAVIAGDLAVVPYGRGSRIAGIKLDGEGDVTDSHRVWTRKDTGSFVPSPVVYDGKIYLVRDGGEVDCLASDTGETLWSERFPKHRAKFYASPVIAGGRLYAPREDGVVFVADIGEGLKLLSENDMGERIIASPAAIAGRLLIRGEKHLFCIGE